MGHGAKVQGGKLWRDHRFLQLDQWQFFQQVACTVAAKLRVFPPARTTLPLFLETVQMVDGDLLSRRTFGFN
jgi:hypothetical protein